MIFINNPENCPFFNIAAEEYLLKNFKEDLLMLWRSNESVVVGKHQVTIAEANQLYNLVNNIPIVRRFSGGGTVFHDKRNINFTLISNSTKPDINFKKHTKPVIEFLKNFGFNAEFEGKNNIRINGYKVSGNAAHIFKNRTLYHGTLLFDSDLDKLRKSINPSNAVIETKAIQSIRSNTSNIKSFFETDISAISFENKFKNFLSDWYNIKEPRGFSVADKHAIKKLVDDKYSQKEWIYYYSRDYRYHNSIKLDGKSYKYSFDVKRGEVVEVFFENTHVSALNLFFNSLKGIKHEPFEVLRLLVDCDVLQSIDITNNQVQKTLKSFF